MEDLSAVCCTLAPDPKTDTLGDVARTMQGDITGHSSLNF